MNPRQLCALILCVATCLNAAPGRYSEHKLPWSELGSAIIGHRITLGLNSGSTLEGNVIAVGSDTIELDVRKSSNKITHPKGKATFPRAQITTMDLHSKVFRGRGIALATGAGIFGATLAIGASMESWDGLAVAFFGAVAGICVMIAGYFIANEHDRRLTRLTILPN